MNEIIIDKNAKQITFTNNGIGFSQFGIANEILDLIENQTKEIERLNNIINELEKFINSKVDYIEFVVDPILDKLQELKGDNNVI